MILKTKQTTEHEVEISIPFFRKHTEHGTTEYISMMSEGYVHSVSESQQTIFASVQPLWIKEVDIIKAYNEWEPVTEKEFLEEYKRVLSSLSLEPIVSCIPAANPDDLKDIPI